MIQPLLTTLSLAAALALAGCSSRPVEILPAAQPQAKALVPQHCTLSESALRDRPSINILSGRLYADAFKFADSTEKTGIAQGRVYFESPNLPGHGENGIKVWSGYADFDTVNDSLLFRKRLSVKNWRHATMISTSEDTVAKLSRAMFKVTGPSLSTL